MPFVSTDNEFDVESMKKARERAKKQRVRIRRDGPDAYVTVSRSDSNLRYYLSIDPDGDITCTCLGFGYRGWCKHVAALQMRLEREQREADRL